MVQGPLCYHVIEMTAQRPCMERSGEAEEYQRLSLMIDFRSR